MLEVDHVRSTRGPRPAVDRAAAAHAQQLAPQNDSIRKEDMKADLYFLATI